MKQPLNNNFGEFVPNLCKQRSDLGLLNVAACYNISLSGMVAQIHIICGLNISESYAMR